jgi:hypothetical protein
MEEILISMKDIIKNVLFRHKDRQPNLASESCRDLIATEIVAVLESTTKSDINDMGLTIEMWKGYNSNQMELDIGDDLNG